MVKMTLIELHDILGTEIKTIADRTNDLSNSDLERATRIASLAKQMINNADIIIRADKLCNTQKVNKLVGDNND